MQNNNGYNDKDTVITDVTIESVNHAIGREKAIPADCISVSSASVQ